MGPPQVNGFLPHLEWSHSLSGVLRLPLLGFTFQDQEHSCLFFLHFWPPTHTPKPFPSQRVQHILVKLSVGPGKGPDRSWFVLKGTAFSALESRRGISPSSVGKSPQILIMEQLKNFPPSPSLQFNSHLSATHLTSWGLFSHLLNGEITTLPTSQDGLSNEKVHVKMLLKLESTL